MDKGKAKRSTPLEWFEEQEELKKQKDELK